jgi:thiol-disulfide isomerase/thioredoxin
MLLAFSLLIMAVHALVEAPDGSVCANMCSGHGDCIDYSCKCYVGYHGDSCSVTFGDENDLVPILTAGHFNLTKKTFSSTISKHSKTGILVGFSSYKCFKCIQAEPTYRELATLLEEENVPFARGDVDAMKALIKDHGVTELPYLVFYHKKRVLVYRGDVSAKAVVAFVKKQTGPPARVLKSAQAVQDFVSLRQAEAHSPSTVVVVGFFSEHDGVEEEDYEDFMQAAKELQSKEDIYFGVVLDPEVSRHYKSTLKLIDRTPSMYVVGETGVPSTINLDEFYDQKVGLSEWIVGKSVPLVGKLTPHNFQLYEKITKPMLMMFLDLRDETEAIQPTDVGGDAGTAVALARGVVGGKSGGILNELLLAEFRAAAVELSDKVSFVYLDGNMYEDKMRALGLYGGVERLPSLAINTRGGVQAPFPEEYGVNKDTMLQFCINFLSGKIKNPNDAKELAKKALVASSPISSKHLPQRRKPREFTKDAQVGVSEQFGDGAVGDDAIVAVSKKTFDAVCMDEEKDVVLLLYAKECESCFHFAVYFKRMAARFKALGIESLVIARMDVTHKAPPAELHLLQGPLPVLVMLPAGAKHPPFAFYSGVGKVQEMMHWVQAQATIPFEMPNLPHLNEEQRVLYKEQIRQREEHLEKKRQEDDEALRLEDEARAAYQQKREAVRAEEEAVRAEEDAEF